MCIGSVVAVVANAPFGTLMGAKMELKQPLFIMIAFLKLFMLHISRSPGTTALFIPTFFPKTSDESKAATTSCKCLQIVKQQLCKFKEWKLNLKAQHKVTKPWPILEVKIN